MSDALTKLRIVEAEKLRQLELAPIICSCGHGSNQHFRDGCCVGGCLCQKNQEDAYMTGAVDDESIEEYRLAVEARVRAELIPHLRYT